MCEPVSIATGVVGGIGAVNSFQQGRAQARRANTVNEYNRQYQDVVNQQNYLNQKAQIDYINQGKVNNYNYQLKVREQNWMREKAGYENDLTNYEAEVADNNFAAQEGYARAQRQLNEVFKQAAFSEQNSLIEMLEATGAAASGRTGKSAQRLDNKVLAQYGRNNAVRAASLSSSKEGYQQAVMDIDRQMRDANEVAFDEVAFAPQPDMAPLAPLLLSDPTKPLAAPTPIPVNGPSNLSLVAGLGSAALSGVSTYNQLKVPRGAEGIGRLA